MSALLPPSGAQHEIVRGDQRATITEVGATLRSYSFGGRPVVDGFDEGEMCTGGRGQALMPWPNRLADGRYSFEGDNHQAPIDQVEEHNSIHGLVRWRSWSAVGHEAHSVVMEHTLHPQPAYPFMLRLVLAYELGDEGLTVTATAKNVGERSCPFGAGFHPYLTAGTAAVDDSVLRVPAARRLQADGRGIPTGSAEVAGTEWDFRTARAIGRTVLDTCYTDLDGAVELTAPDSRSIRVWWDDAFSCVMVFTGDTLSPERRRRGLAVEPMTCPPDAFNSGSDLVVLEPQACWTGRFGISAREPG